MMRQIVRSWRYGALLVGAVLVPAPLSTAGAEAADDAAQIAQESGDVDLGNFGAWSARRYTASDGSQACAIDSRSPPSPSGERQWLTVAWSRGQGASFVWFAPSPALGSGDGVRFEVGGNVYRGITTADGAAYLETNDDAAMQRAVAAGSGVTVTIEQGGGAFTRGPFVFTADGFKDAYARIGGDCGFDTASILGSTGGSATSTPTATDEQLLATYQDWMAYTWLNADKARVCSADSSKRAIADKGPDLYVYWGSSKDPYGYLVFKPHDVPLDAADRVALDVGGVAFEMFVDKGQAFPYSESDLKIIQAMAGGATLAITVTPSAGSVRNYQYSLAGFTDAYHRIGTHCGFDTAWLMPQPLVQPTPEAEPSEPVLRPEQVTAAMRSERRVALIIGNGAYGVNDYQAPLAGPANDAAGMRDRLNALGFQVITALDADIRAINRAVGEFNDALSQGGVGLFYYSGHGMQINDENFLIPIGAQMDSALDAMTEAFSVNTLVKLMQIAPTRLNIIILDACRSNPFVAAQVGERGLSLANQGLAKIEVPEAAEFVIAYAAAPGRNSAEPVTGGPTNGYYTAALLDALNIPGLELQAVLRHTRAAVRKRTNGEQIPWTSTSVEHPFYFNLP
jgi:hypothetical protein